MADIASVEVVSAVRWISSLVWREVDALIGVKDQVETLKYQLQFIRECLQIADERKKLGENHSFSKMMRDLAFDAEDVVDDYILKVSARTQQTSSGPVDSLARHAHFVLNIPHVWKVKRQIEQVLSRLESLKGNYGTYGATLLPRVPVRKQMQHTYPYDEENGDYVVGLENETLELLLVLQDNERNKTNNNIRGLAIVGMGGSGKTTLARKLYNHSSIKESFKCKAWVSVSQDWSTKRLLSEFLRQVGGPRALSKIDNGSCVPQLVAELRDILKKESYLVVLDDVWETQALIDLRPVLLCGGGKIIITSRKLEVAEFQNLQCNLRIYEPKPLGENEARLLFNKIALSPQTSYHNSKEKFDELGKEMLKKCFGLPLAIKVLAGILNSKESIEEWERVKEAVTFKVMQGPSTSTQGSVKEMLALSYDDLPSELKPCFLYLSAFPEDCEIPTGKLTRMWIAEGLVTEEDMRSPEDVAMAFIEELRRRFMIQVVRINFQGIIKVIQLHDLLRDLCVIKANDQRFLQIHSPKTKTQTHAFRKDIQSRRAALHNSTSFPKNSSKLRSLTLLANSCITCDIGNMHRDFKLLKLLNLCGITTVSGTLPHQIGSLIHLRYLGIHSSNIRQLPSSIGNLRNLLTLDYRIICSNQIEPVTIPSSLCKLVLLRHLFLPIECAWNEKELQLSALKDLQVLWGVKCRGGVWFSREMANLTSTMKKLKVAVSTETDLVATFKCCSLMLHQLHTFHCEWRDGIVLQEVNSAFHGLHLHKVVLVGKIQSSTFSLMLPSNVVILELKDTVLQYVDGEDDNPMVFIGALARLKRLKLSNFYLGSTFICKLHSFPQLEELHLENLNHLKIWSVNEGAMSSLKKLMIFYCGKLQEFPLGLPFVANLEKLEYFGVPEKFGQKAIECGWPGEKLTLPHNFQAIIKMCDSKVDISPITKLYEQLTAGVFFRKRWQRYWVVKLDGRYYNCFMLYTTFYDTVKDTNPDVKELQNIGLCKLTYGSWVLCTMVESSNGGSAVVGKLESVPPITSSFPIVQGSINIEYLTPNTSYEIAFKIKLPQSRLNLFRERKNIICQTRVVENNGNPVEQEHDFSDMPRDEWIQFYAGPFKPSSSSGYVKFFLTRICVGVLFQGVIIQPKVEAHR